MSENQNLKTEEKESMEKAETGLKKENLFAKKLKKRLSAKRLAFMGVFVALSYVVSIFSFALFPSSGVFFLELDFGNVFIMLVSFLLGPVEGIVVCILKEGLHVLLNLKGGTGGVGELANAIMTSAFILIPSIVYQYRKGIKTVSFTLVIACVVGTAVALLTNRFITFPLFLKESAAQVFEENFWFILAFNLIKTVSVSVVTILLYKRLSNLLKKMKI